MEIAWLLSIFFGCFAIGYVSPNIFVAILGGILWSIFLTWVFSLINNQ